LHKAHQIIVDILPFGGIEKAGYVHFNDQFNTVISTLGLNEVYQSLLDGGLTSSDLKMASLPGLCLLKVISWNDNPETRKKDLNDLYYLLKYAFDIEEDEIFKSHLDLFDDDDFDTVLAGCRVLGRQSVPILGKSEKLKEKMIEILEGNTKDIEKSRMGDIMASISNETVERVVQMLNFFLLGMSEEVNPDNYLR
jgi:predicted nucleotidyltransferase